MFLFSDYIEYGIIFEAVLYVTYTKGISFEIILN